MAKTEIEMLEEIKSGLDANSKEYKELKAAQDAAVETTTKLLADIEKKGATIEEMHSEIKELKAKSGRIKGQQAPQTSVKQLIADTIEEHKAAIGEFKGGTTEMKIETKTVGPIL